MELNAALVTRACATLGDEASAALACMEHLATQRDTTIVVLRDCLPTGEGDELDQRQRFEHVFIGLFRTLARSADTSVVRYINLARTPVGDACGLALADVVGVHVVLESLDLDSCAISDVSMVPILRALAGNPHSRLKNIDMRSNLLGDETVAELGLTLRQARTLQLLNLSGNGAITSLEPIIDALRSGACSPLRRVVVTPNERVSVLDRDALRQALGALQRRPSDSG